MNERLCHFFIIELFNKDHIFLPSFFCIFLQLFTRQASLLDWTSDDTMKCTQQLFSFIILLVTMFFTARVYFPTTICDGLMIIHDFAEYKEDLLQCIQNNLCCPIYVQKREFLSQLWFGRLVILLERVTVRYATYYGQENIFERILEILAEGINLTLSFYQKFTILIVSFIVIVIVVEVQTSRQNRVLVLEDVSSEKQRENSDCLTEKLEIESSKFAIEGRDQDRGMLRFLRQAQLLCNNFQDLKVYISNLIFKEDATTFESVREMQEL